MLARASSFVSAPRGSVSGIASIGAAPASSRQTMSSASRKRPRAASQRGDSGRSRRRTQTRRRYLPAARQIEEQAANVPASEIQKYYTDHQANFDEGEVLRLTIPKAAATESGQPLDASAVKATADALRARAAAGEDFDQLQQAAYKELGLEAPPSATKLNKVRRTRLAPDEAKVFELKAGEVSEVMESPGAFVILKLDSKQSIPIETAGSEIKAILRQARLEQEIQSASKNVKAQFNLTYLEMPAAPELFVAPALARPGVVPGTPPNGRSRKWPPRRMPSSSCAQGATLLPQPHN